MWFCFLTSHTKGILHFYVSVKDLYLVLCISYSGLLERPILPASTAVEDVNYKLAVVGKAGVGKTSTIAHLSGRPVPEGHCETAGREGRLEHYNPAKVLNTQHFFPEYVILKI